MNRSLSTAAILAVMLLMGTPALAEHRKVVDGLEINIGVVPAEQLLRVDAYERAAHREAATNATHHVVVGVADARSGEPIGDARVSVDLVDPRGGTQTRTLARGDADGHPDYSGLFRFGWAGAYKLRVDVERSGAAPVRTTFNWTQDGY
jgi:hypothetical protein